MRSFVIRGAGLLIALAALGDFVSTQPPKAPSYVEHFEKILAAQPADNSGTLFDLVSTTELAARLGKKTGKKAHHDLAVKLFETLLGDKRFKLVDFHILQGFGRLVLILQRDNLLTLNQKKAVSKIAISQLKTFRDSTDNSDNNIRIAQVLGYACLLKYLNGTPDDVCGQALDRFDEYWNPLVKTGDLDEDATNYDSLGALFLVDLAKTCGREDALRRSPGFRRMFERFREVVSPSGMVPEFGDSYFQHLGIPYDRVVLLEYAAWLYDDPSFLHSARKLWARSAPGLPRTDPWFRGLRLIDGDRSPRAPTPPSDPPSLVTFRLNRESDRPLIDKLILRGGWTPGSPMVMLDLYAGGSHSHPEKGPSIAYYEVDHVPLFHNLGRHRVRSAITGNSLWALPAVERFPGCWNQDDAWFTMTIPVDYLNHKADRYMIAESMSLRNFQEFNRKCQYLYFDNMRLEGPAGTLLVDDFEDAKRWDAKVAKKTEIVLSDEKTQGKHSERLEWKSLPSEQFDRKLTQAPKSVFSKKDYDTLKLDVKYKGTRPYLHIRGLGKQVDLGDQLLSADIVDAKAEQRGGDAFGLVRYKSYITADTELTRRLVLTAEGYLVVHDLLVPGKSMTGWNAGQLWQLYDMKAKGPDWFCSDDDGPYPVVGAVEGETRKRRMLVRFAAANGEIGLEQVKQGYHCPNPKNRSAERFFTTFSRRPVEAGRKEAFALAVLPHAPENGEPDAMSEKVSLETKNGTTIAVFGKTGDRSGVEVVVSEQGWEVKRAR